jgi:hypothetical protein
MKNKNLYRRLINRNYHRWEKKRRYLIRNKDGHLLEMPIKTRKGKIVLLPWRYTYYRSKAF